MATNFFKITNKSGQNITIVLKGNSGAGVTFRSPEEVPTTYGEKSDTGEFGFSLSPVFGSSMIITDFIDNNGPPPNPEMPMMFNMSGPAPDSAIYLESINKYITYGHKLWGNLSTSYPYNLRPSSVYDSYSLAQNGLCILPYVMEFGSNSKKFTLVFNGNTDKTLGIGGRILVEQIQSEEEESEEEEAPGPYSMNNPEFEPIRNSEDLQNVAGLVVLPTASLLRDNDDVSVTYRAAPVDSINNIGFTLGELKPEDEVASMVEWKFDYPTWDDPRTEITYGLAMSIDGGPIEEHYLTVERGSVPEAKWYIPNIAYKLKQALMAEFPLLEIDEEIPFTPSIISAATCWSDTECINGTSHFLIDVNEFSYKELYIANNPNDREPWDVPLDYIENESPYDTMWVENDEEGEEIELMRNGVVSVWGYYTYHYSFNENEEPQADDGTFIGRKVITFYPNHTFTNPVDYDLAVNSEVCNGDAIKGVDCKAFNVYSNGCQHSYIYLPINLPPVEV